MEFTTESVLNIPLRVANDHGKYGTPRRINLWWKNSFLKFLEES